jgi:hypothetical protein
MFDRLHLHLNALAIEIEQAMKRHRLRPTKGRQKSVHDVCGLRAFRSVDFHGSIRFAEQPAGPAVRPRAIPRKRTTSGERTPPSRGLVLLNLNVWHRLTTRWLMLARRGTIRPLLLNREERQTSISAKAIVTEFDREYYVLTAFSLALVIVGLVALIYTVI